ncbi:hypothetical protein HanPI659440_Chr02g0049071 [Helianthus annuus]|nr:hypothetical protein HanPI659440_Chr02g0049071 [Helianthus annuus]
MSRLLLCLRRKEPSSKKRLLLLPLNQRLIWELLLRHMGTCWKKYTWLLVLAQGDVEIEQVGEGDAGGAGGDGATPRHTIYTRRPPGAGGGATSKPPQSPEFENIHVGSWDTDNSACDDLPHAPRWRLTQGSRMSDRDNFHEFFSLSLPPAERLFQKRRNRFDLLDDHIHAEVNFFATSQEIVREWKLMREDTLEFENAKKAFAKENEKFNAEKKGLLWRISDAEMKLAQEKDFNINKQKEWEIDCERTNT